MDKFFYYALGGMAALVAVVLGVALFSSGGSRIDRAAPSAATPEATPANVVDLDTRGLEEPPPIATPTPTPVPSNPPNPGPTTVVKYPGFNVVYSPLLGNPVAVQYAMVNDAKPQRYGEPEAVQTPAKGLIEAVGYAPGKMALENSIELYFGRVASRNTALMTNLAAFYPATLEGPWAAFPELEQRWAGIFGWIEIVAGPIFDNPPTQIGGIVVPSGFFRAYRRSYGDTIAFVIPQGATSSEMKNYLTSIAAVEAATGLEIFSDTVPLVERQRVSEGVW